MNTENNRVGGLTRMQTARWLSLYWKERNGLGVVLSDVWNLPEPSTPEAVFQAILAVCGGHDILRTTFRLGPAGLPEQRVTHPADFVPPVHFTEGGAPATSRPSGIGTAESDSPLWCLVCEAREGLVTSVAVHFRHIVADGSGLAEWRSQFLQALAAGQEWRPVQVVNPLDRPLLVGGAEEERAGHDRSPQAVATPQSLVPLASRPGSEHLDYRSSSVVPGLTDTLRRISDMTGATPRVVAKFSLAWWLCSYTSQDRVQIANVVYQGRFGSSAIDCQVENICEMVRLHSDQSFREALARLQDSTLRTYLRSEEIHYEAGLREYAEELRNRGIAETSVVYFNYLTPQQWKRGEGAKRPDYERAVPLEQGVIDCLAPVVVFDQLDDQDLRLTVLADADIIHPDLAGELASALSRLLTRIGNDPSRPVRSADTDFPDEHRARTGARYIGSRWLCPDSLASHLRGIDGVLQAHVETAGESVVSELTLEHGTEVFTIHERVCELLFHERDICAPDLYRWTYTNRSPGRGATRGPHAGEWWPATDPVPVVFQPLTWAEKVLAGAVEQVNGVRVDNLALTYAQAGGAIVRAPGVVRLAEERGLAGFRREHFTAPFTLRSVARRLSRG